MMFLAGAGALLLGAAGFCAGFFGPIALNPSANQGPLVGLLITGPGGLIGGAALGALCGLLGVSRRAALGALSAAAVVFAGATLWYCLPEPAYLASVIEFDVVRCESPAQRKPAAFEYWDKRVAAVTWAPARPGWKDGFDALAAAEPGAVLTVKLTRSASILENRRPWNKGTTVMGPGRDDLPDAYFLPGASCASLPPAVRGPWRTKDAPSKQWPPETLSGLLNLLVLEPVPGD